MLMEIICVGGKRNYTELIMSVLAPVLMGVLSFMLVKNYASTYFGQTGNIFRLLPQICFPIIWFITLVFMGTASYRAKLAAPQSASHVYYATQLLIAFIWNIMLLRFNEVKIAFIIMIVFLFFLTATFFGFDKIDKKAGILMLPAIIWAIVLLGFNFAGL